RSLCLPVNLAFIWDGQDKPAIKRGTRVIAHEHWLAPACKELIGEFGYQSYQARGDAEAEMCMLQRKGHLDIVWSADSDVWPFGATHVIRRAVPGLPSHVQLYSAREIEMKIGVKASGWLVFALVCGGDYDVSKASSSIFSS
ncbi:PIN domain-like protein, partial [Schizophyllum amplum]